MEILYYSQVQVAWDRGIDQTARTLKCWIVFGTLPFTLRRDTLVVMRLPYVREDNDWIISQTALSE